MCLSHTVKQISQMFTQACKCYLFTSVYSGTSLSGTAPQMFLRIKFLACAIMFRPCFTGEANGYLDYRKKCMNNSKPPHGTTSCNSPDNLVLRLNIAVKTFVGRIILHILRNLLNCMYKHMCPGGF